MTREEAIIRLKGLYGNGYTEQEQALDMAIQAIYTLTAISSICDSAEMIIEEQYGAVIPAGYVDVFELIKKKVRLWEEDLAEQNVGEWKKISPAGIYECSECGQTVMTSDIYCYNFCHNCGNPKNVSGWKETAEVETAISALSEKTTINSTKTTITDGDLISRTNLLNKIWQKEYGKDYDGVNMLNIPHIDIIENMPSAEKTAEWKDGYCSNCGCDIPAYIIDWKWQKDMDAKYCPNCGCRMKEVE